MKVNFYSLLAVSGLAFGSLALYSCNDDKMPSGPDKQENMAYMGLSISFPEGAFSKAADASDQTAESTEAKVTTVDVYVKTQRAGAVATLAERLNPATDFTLSGNKYVANKSLKVRGTAGDMSNVYVVINAPETDMSQYVDGNIPYVKNVADFTVNDRFTMFNVIDREVTLSTDSANAMRVDVNVERIVSKILVKAAAGLNFNGMFADKNGNGQFDGSKLRWRVGHSNRKVFALPKGLPGSSLGFEDPNYIYTAGQPYSAYATEYEQLSGLDGKITPGLEPNIEIAPANIGATGFDATKGYVGYANENTNDSSVVANTTYVLLSSVFIPSNLVTDVTGGTPTNPTLVRTANSVVTTFYYHIRSGAYFTKAAFDKYVAGTVIPGGRIEDFVASGKPYENGVCYFYFNVKNGDASTTRNKLGTLRNHFYTASISSFAAPGAPINPTVVEPDINRPAENQDVFIAVDVTVNPWTGVNMGSIDLK